MSIFETVGMAFVIFTSAFGTITLGQHVWRSLDAAKRQRERGAVEEQRDVIEAAKVREALIR